MSVARTQPRCVASASPASLRTASSSRRTSAACAISQWYSAISLKYGVFDSSSIRNVARIARGQSFSCS